MRCSSRCTRLFRVRSPPGTPIGAFAAGTPALGPRGLPLRGLLARLAESVPAAAPTPHSRPRQWPTPALRLQAYSSQFPPVRFRQRASASLTAARLLRYCTHFPTPVGTPEPSGVLYSYSMLAGNCTCSSSIVWRISMRGVSPTRSLAILEVQARNPVMILRHYRDRREPVQTGVPTRIGDRRRKSGWQAKAPAPPCLARCWTSKWGRRFRLPTLYRAASSSASRRRRQPGIRPARVPAVGPG